MTDRWNTRYTTSGRGPALVLIHGVGLDLTMWDAVLPTLEPCSRTRDRVIPRRIDSS